MDTGSSTYIIIDLYYNILFTTVSELSPKKKGDITCNNCVSASEARICGYGFLTYGYIKKDIIVINKSVDD